jgi:penicillin-binding protein 1A
LAITRDRDARATWAASVRRVAEFKPGYLSEFIIRDVDKKNHRLRVEMQPIPARRGRIDDNQREGTGEIMAMQGGYDFLANKFNNAVQAYRQTGSAFKPFIYTAGDRVGA